MKDRYSRHHLLPRSMNWSNEPENIVVLKENTHRAIHTLFANKMIAEQLLTTVDISSKALREDVRQWLIETLTTELDPNNPYDWYKDIAIK